MKAMILAAGLGTRLRPLTDTRPKALVEINGLTLLEITLTRLRSFGVTDVIVNVHHFADMVVDYLKSRSNFGMRIEISREDDLLLDTGGGLKKAAWFFLQDPRSSVAQGEVPARPAGGRGALRPSLPQPGSIPNDEPFLLHNVDVISTIDFRRMLQFHNEQGALATLAVQSRQSSRLLLFDDQLRLSGRAPSQGESVIPSGARDPGKPPAYAIGDPTTSVSASSRSPLVHPERLSREATSHSFTQSKAEGPLPLAFSGIHVISPRLLPLITETGVFSIIDTYLRLAAQGERILAFRADEYYWRDLGRPSDLTQAARDIQQGVPL
ncbi:MAG TPA: nucleotidyltransferase family protein [Candidatus Angelobacter sp.]|nr:nucleotidyltransferase family protein [Candidatus Angelobacter sp.]